MVRAIMSLKDQLLRVANAYASSLKTRGRNGLPSLAGISTRVFGDGKTFARIAAGGDVTTTSFEKAMRWFSANWPDDLEWPQGVDRPVVSTDSGEAA